MFKIGIVLLSLSALSLVVGCASAEKSVAAKSQDVRTPASLREIRCENNAKNFVLVKSYGGGIYDQGTQHPKKTLTYGGTVIDFPYYGGVTPDGTGTSVTWISADKSYVEMRSLTRPETGHFAIYFNAKTQKTVTEFVYCQEILDGQ